MTRQDDVATQDDVAFDDMAMEKYHVEYQKLSLEELYLQRRYLLESKQASNDLAKAKLNEETFISSKRIDLGD